MRAEQAGEGACVLVCVDAWHAGRMGCYWLQRVRERMACRLWTAASMSNRVLHACARTHSGQGRMGCYGSRVLHECVSTHSRQGYGLQPAWGIGSYMHHACVRMNGRQTMGCSQHGQ